MGYLHLVFPAKSLSNLDAVILIMVTRRIDDVLLKHGGQLHVLPLPVHLKKVEGIIHSLRLSDSQSFFVWDPSFMLKSYKWMR